MAGVTSPVGGYGVRDLHRVGVSYFTGVPERSDRGVEVGRVSGGGAPGDGMGLVCEWVDYIRAVRLLWDHPGVPVVHWVHAQGEPPPRFSGEVGVWVREACRLLLRVMNNEDGFRDRVVLEKKLEPPTGV